MPQMAPYNWLILFCMFNLINFIIISINYYSFSPKSKIIPKIKFMNKYHFLW